MFSVHVNRMLAIRDGYGQKSESAFQFLNSCPYSCVGAYFVWVPIILYGTHTSTIIVLLSCSDRLFLLLDTPVMLRMMVLDVVNKPPIFVQDGTFTLGL